MRTFFISLFAILLAVQASVVSATEMQYGVPAPTIFESQIQELQDGSLLITGVTFNNTVVDVYIDGVFNGRATVVNDNSGVASFAYKSFLPLVQGEHSIYTVARSLDETVRSKQSASILVVIPATPIAPTNLSIELDDAGKSKIVGNILNDYEVEIFIEGRKFVSFIPPSSAGAVTSFWYKPGLPNGDYTVAIRSKSPEGVFSSFVSQVLTFGSPAYEKVSEKNDTNNDVMVVKKDDDLVELIVENSQEDVSPTNVLDKLEEQDEVVIVDEQNNDAKVIVDNTESKDKVVIDKNKTTEEIVVPTTKDDEVVVFGENDNELDSEINGGVSEVASESDTDNSRKTGFVLLLIVVIVLAIWYIREKQKALLGEKEAKDEENKDQITMDEIKEKIQHVVEEIKQEKQNDNTVSEQKRGNKEKKKNKKRRR